MTREQLAVEIAERNDRCGHVDRESICLRPREHAGAHIYEPIKKVVPIQ